MPIARVNGIDLYYEDRGDPADPAVLLVMGLGTQLIAWPEAFVAQLVDAGLRVVAYDNRDVGQSTHLYGARTPNLVVALTALRLGLPLRLPYTLKDMAHDGVALLDALGIRAAHVVGASMGGMIAQNMAIYWPERVLTLTSVMSTSGARGLPGPSPEMRRRLLARRPAKPSRESAIAAGAEALEAIGFPDPARDARAYRDLAARSYDRGHDPGGFRRQLLAIMADRHRAARLAEVRAPTLVIHGAADPLVPLACGQDVARRVPGALMEVVDRMAHDLPPSEVGRVAGLIVAHVRG